MLQCREQVVMAEPGFWDSERGWVSKERFTWGQGQPKMMWWE